MEKLPVSNKQGSFGAKPYIKKGYYPGQLLKVEPYLDKDGNLKEGKYGRQLIFTFAVFKPDPETDAPTVVMQYKPDPAKDEKKPVFLPKFVYHQYKAKDPKEGEPLFQTAITPNSAITALLISLGWEFSAEDGVDPEAYVGNWVELNIDDYEIGEGDEKYVASTIKDINEYKGPTPSPEIKTEEVPKPNKVEKQMKHEDVKEAEKKQEVETANPKLAQAREKLEKMKGLHKDGYVSDEGFKQASEQLEAEIKELEK